MTKPKQPRHNPSEIISAELRENELWRAWVTYSKNKESWGKRRQAHGEYDSARLKTLRLKRKI